MLITGAEIEGRAPLDVRCRGNRIVAVDEGLDPLPAEEVVEADGGALLPGLHDHHTHLLALAAAEGSLVCGPPAVRNIRDLALALEGAASTTEWIRGVGYHESVAGDLDRAMLDDIVGDRPARIQHRSGALWILSTAGLRRLGIDAGTDLPGIERGVDGKATGRLFRADSWLRSRLPAGSPPDLGPVGRRLASYGVTGVTDATAGNGEAELALLLDAVRCGHLPQRLLVMGTRALPRVDDAAVSVGAVKLVLDESALPDIDEFGRDIADVHAGDRSVAIHCVTRAELVLALAALTEAGVAAGDRIEHASVAPPDLVEVLAALGLTVVTQPGFVRERGDVYLTDVEPRDRPWLYRGHGFLEASVPLAAGTDAPFGSADPWLAIRAAVDRRTVGGAVLGPGEGLSPERALALFTSPPEAPGAAPRRIAVGAPADLCLLTQPWRTAREELSSSLVAATILAGSLVRRHPA